jgi:DNA repair photolyase
MMRVFNSKYKHAEVETRDLLKALEKECAKGISKQVLLSFTTDPYNGVDKIQRLTRKVLEIFERHGTPTAILTKGGTQALCDLDLFKKMGQRIKIGSSLTYWNESETLKNEKGSALPEDRLELLRVCHAEGITTWASMEPVLDPAQSLKLMEESLDFVDHYKIGKLNYEGLEKKIDWEKFLLDSVKLMRDSGKEFYIKTDLAAYAPTGFSFNEAERNADNLALNYEPDQMGLL